MSEISLVTSSYSHNKSTFKLVVQYYLSLRLISPVRPIKTTVKCPVVVVHRHRAIGFTEYTTSMVVPTPAAFPAGVDPNRGHEETVRNSGVL